MAKFNENLAKLEEIVKTRGFKGRGQKFRHMVFKGLLLYPGMNLSQKMKADEWLRENGKEFKDWEKLPYEKRVEILETSSPITQDEVKNVDDCLNFLED